MGEGYMKIFFMYVIEALFFTLIIAHKKQNQQ